MRPYTAISAYAGRVATQEEHNMLADSNSLYFNMMIGLDTATAKNGRVVQLVVDATEMGNEMREINHYQDLSDLSNSLPKNVEFVLVGRRGVLNVGAPAFLCHRDQTKCWNLFAG